MIKPLRHDQEQPNRLQITDGDTILEEIGNHEKHVKISLIFSKAKIKEQDS